MDGRGWTLIDTRFDTATLVSSTRSAATAELRHQELLRGAMPAQGPSECASSPMRAAWERQPSRRLMIAAPEMGSSVKWLSSA